MTAADWANLDPSGHVANRPLPHPTETMPSNLFLTRRCGMLEREQERLLNLIASAVARLHGDDDRMEVADFLEREAAPF